MRHQLQRDRITARLNGEYGNGSHLWHTNDCWHLYCYYRRDEFRWHNERNAHNYHQQFVADHNFNQPDMYHRGKRSIHFNCDRNKLYFQFNC